jgi:hypothetical protein
MTAASPGGHSGSYLGGAKQELERDPSRPVHGLHFVCTGRPPVCRFPADRLRQTGSRRGFFILFCIFVLSLLPDEPVSLLQ